MKKAGKSESDFITSLGRWIINKVNTADWRKGKVTGFKHYGKEKVRIICEDTGLSSKIILVQAKALRDKGIISLVLDNVETSIKEITFPVENMEALCAFEKVDNVIGMTQTIVSDLEHRRNNAKADWLVKYYDNKLSSVEDKGNISADVQNKGFLDCMDEVAAIKEPEWKRKFSARVCGGSKIFENTYQSSVILAYKKYAMGDQDEQSKQDMEDYQVLTELGLKTYSQTIQWKGPVVYRFGDTSESQLIDSSVMVSSHHLKEAF